MAPSSASRLPKILAGEADEILADWLTLLRAGGAGDDRISVAELERQADSFIRRLSEAVRLGNVTDIDTPAFAPVRELLDGVSRARALKGFSPSQTAGFVFSLKEPLFGLLRREVGDDAVRLAEEILAATALLDRLGLYITEVFQKIREDVISRQQQELLELSTPVVHLWDGILALPLIGTLDSAAPRS